MNDRGRGWKRAGLPIGMLAAVALGMSGRAQAQWGGGYGFGAGYGFGGFGGFGGWGGGFGMMGMTLADQEVMKAQYYMMNTARYNTMNAETAQNYAAANLMQQQAMSAALENERLSMQIAQDKYNLYSKAKNASMAAAAANAPRIALSDLIDSQGRVRWPESAPSAGAHAERRAAADQAIQEAYADFTKDGHADVSLVVDAKRRLQAYGQPALTLLRGRNDARGRSNLLTFLRALDAALDNMGTGPSVPAAPAPAEQPKAQ